MISHYLCYPAKAAVEKTGVPHVSVQLTYEHTPTEYRPCRIGMPNLGPRLNSISWAELFQGAGVALKPPYLRFWNDKGLPPFDDLWSLYFSRDLNLIAVSELFCPQQPDWEDLHVVTGFLNLPSSTSRPQLSDKVKAFLADGEPPLFMTFGSAGGIYSGASAERDTRLFVDAAIKADCRAVIQTTGGKAAEWMESSTSDGNDQILFTDWIPYDEILSRCSLAVHHAGIGTCQLALKHGCPSVVIPFTEHHALFANRLHQLGVCPRPLMRKSITPTALAAQIAQALANPNYHRQAEAYGNKLRGEDGVGRAVEVIMHRFGA